MPSAAACCISSFYCIRLVLWIRLYDYRLVEGRFRRVVKIVPISQWWILLGPPLLNDAKCRDVTWTPRTACFAAFSQPSALFSDSSSSLFSYTSQDRRLRTREYCKLLVTTRVFSSLFHPLCLCVVFLLCLWNASFVVRLMCLPSNCFRLCAINRAPCWRYSPPRPCTISNA